MEISYTEIGIIVGLVMGGFKLLEKGFEYLYKVFIKQSDKENTDSKQEIQLTVFMERFNGLEKQLLKIETNDLAHNATEHKEIKEMIIDMRIDIAKILEKLK